MKLCKISLCRRVRLSCAALLLISAVIFNISCSDSEQPDIDEAGNKYESILAENSDNAYPIPTSGVEPESVFYASEGDSSSSIISCFAAIYTTVGDRIYYETTIGTTNTIVYISANTGERFTLCPDPLCTHQSDSSCRYQNMEQVLPSEDPSVIYTVKTVRQSGGPSLNVICRVDVQNDVITELYGRSIPDDVFTEKVRLRFIADNKLYFAATRYRTVKDEDGVETREASDVMIALDLETNKTIEFDNEYASGAKGEYYHSDGEHIIFLDRSSRRLFVTDMNFENETTLLEYDADKEIFGLLYDTVNHEYYVSVCTYNSGGEQSDEWQPIENYEGYLYRINSAYECERVVLPTDKLLNFQLTDSNIYYMEYDPVYYGITYWGVFCVDSGSSKVYRVSRENASEAELVFDSMEAFCFEEYYACRNHLYINATQLVREDGDTWFSFIALARVDIENNTLKWLNFD